MGNVDQYHVIFVKVFLMYVLLNKKNKRKRHKNNILIFFSLYEAGLTAYKFPKKKKKDMKLQKKTTQKIWFYYINKFGLQQYEHGSILNILQSQLVFWKLKMQKEKSASTVF